MSWMGPDRKNDDSINLKDRKSANSVNLLDDYAPGTTGRHSTHLSATPVPYIVDKSMKP